MSERGKGTSGARLERKLEHWRRIIESACEQCGQLHLPQLHEPRTLQHVLDSPPAADLIMLCPGAAALPLDLPATSLAILVGPEGGWSEELRPEDCVHTLIVVLTDEGLTGLGSGTPGESRPACPPQND